MTQKDNNSSQSQNAAQPAPAAAPKSK